MNGMIPGLERRPPWYVLPPDIGAGSEKDTYRGLGIGHGFGSWLLDGGGEYTRWWFPLVGSPAPASAPVKAVPFVWCSSITSRNGDTAASAAVALHNEPAEIYPTISAGSVHPPAVAMVAAAVLVAVVAAVTTEETTDGQMFAQPFR